MYTSDDREQPGNQGCGNRLAVGRVTGVCRVTDAMTADHAGWGWGRGIIDPCTDFCSSFETVSHKSM